MEHSTKKKGAVNGNRSSAVVAKNTRCAWT